VVALGPHVVGLPPGQQALPYPLAGDEGSALYRTDPARAEAFLTEYSHRLGNAAVERYWKLSDEIWVRFNNVF